MCLAGGLAFCLIGVVQRQLKTLKFVYRMIAAGIIITIIEVVFGQIVNRWLSLNVWDYSSIPFNLGGQICLSYTVLWCFVSAPMLILTELIREHVFKRANKPYNMSKNST